jgi:hypothetical protein
MCVCSLCYIVPASSTNVQSAQDMNWDVLTEHIVTWATYKAV